MPSMALTVPYIQHDVNIVTLNIRTPVLARIANIQTKYMYTSNLTLGS